MRSAPHDGPRLAPRFALRPQWALSLAAALTVVGFVAAAQWNGSLGRQEFTTSAQDVLSRQVAALEAEQKRLRAGISDAEHQVQDFQEKAAGSQSVRDELQGQLDAARLAAALTPVGGPGIVIEIADSKRIVPAGDNPSNYIVLVDDLRDIVTALWASGADAISINGERLSATTSIYGVGSSVLVNSSFLSPVFRIEAIGSDGLLDRFSNSPAFLARVSQRITSFGLEFATATADDLQLPAYVGNTAFKWGVPVEAAK
ncbi:MAG TPA: DUF881 domain-containing protein [Candidatus Limnocylindria bacterium]|jgi:uncharacterized protein YlxW (UPF0749 family)|nr:DUF881 domain-containing protein [Candidatus Limnocylindria bacterium]